MKSCYNMSFLSFLNNPKDLDLSFKMDLDFRDCFRRKKTLFNNQRHTVVLRVNSIEKGGKMENGRVVSPESILIHLNTDSKNKQL